jgi:hypothetical protein
VGLGRVLVEENGDAVLVALVEHGGCGEHALAPTHLSWSRSIFIALSLLRVVNGAFTR